MRLIKPLSEWWRTRSLALQIAAVTMGIVVTWWSAIEWSSRELVAVVYAASADAQALRVAELRLAALGDALVRAERPLSPADREAAIRHIGRQTRALRPMVRPYAGPSAARDVFARAFMQWSANPSPLAESALLAAHESFVAAVHADADAAIATEAAALSGARAGARRLRIALLALVGLLVVAAHRSVTRTLRDVVRGATGLANGDYESSKLLVSLHGSREGRELAHALDRLGFALDEREQIARSEILQLRELEQMKTDFVSTVSHELRTPLTSIRGSLGLVLATTRAGLDEKAKRLLQIASQNTDRLIRLINDILDVEKIEAGHVALKLEAVELRAVLRTALTGMEGFATDAGVSLRLAPGEPVPAVADPDRLVQVVTNLVSNAIKFSPAGSSVEIRLETTDDSVCISVRDQGPGIPAEFRNKIFGKFQQADVSDAKPKSGTGLGLAIARAIVVMHDGDITFESEPGRGATFTVTLPWTPPLSRRTPIGGIALVPNARGGQRRATILIAERDAGVRELLASLCAPLGDVVCAVSAQEAVEASETMELDAVIVDPELDAAGPLFALRLRQRLNGDAIPLLVFSGREYGAGELDGLLLSDSHAFVKSRDSERELVMRLRAVLAARRAGDTPTRRGA